MEKIKKSKMKLISINIDEETEAKIALLQEEGYNISALVRNLIKAYKIKNEK